MSLLCVSQTCSRSSLFPCCLLSLLSYVLSPLHASSLEAMIAFTLLVLQSVIKVLVCVLSVCSSPVMSLDV